MSFNDRYNTDDVHLRAVLIGLIDLLNRKVIIEYAISDTESKLTPIPFYPHMSNMERFMQDFYEHYHPDCDTVYAEGNYDPVPRGIVSLTSLVINSAELTNKFVRGTYNKKVDGQLQAYSDYMNIIPLRISYNVEIMASSLLEAMKITQEFIATFYKAAPYQVHYKGFRIQCRAGFSQDYSIERPIEFSYGDSIDTKVVFPIEIETYQPVIGDPNNANIRTDMFKGNTMSRGIGNELYSVSGVSGVYTRFTGEVDPAMNRPDDRVAGDHNTPPQIDA